MRRHFVLPMMLMMPLCSVQAQSPAEQAAAEADLEWLHLIDAANYQAAWLSAGKAMQSARPETEFAQTIGRTRAPFGPVRLRTLRHADFTERLPGAPDGQYVIAQYSTGFTHKADAVETVIASLEADGQWHVSGYFIR